MPQPVGAATATSGAGAKSDAQRGYTLQATFRAKEGFQSHPPFRFPLLSSPPPKAPAGGSPPRQATPTEGRSALYGTLTKGHRPLEPANRAPIGYAPKLPLWTGIIGVRLPLNSCPTSANSPAVKATITRLNFTSRIVPQNWTDWQVFRPAKTMPGTAAFDSTPSRKTGVSSRYFHTRIR
jgi:hypothetical protein